MEYEEIFANATQTAPKEQGVSAGDWLDLVTPETIAAMHAAGNAAALNMHPIPEFVLGIDPPGGSGVWRDATLSELWSIEDLEMRAWAIAINDLYGHEDSKKAELIRSVDGAGMVGVLVQARLQGPRLIRRIPPPWWKPFRPQRKVFAGDLFHDFGIQIEGAVSE